MIYYLIIVLLALFSLNSQFVSNKYGVWFLRFLSFFLILVVGGLRDEVGADWYAYEGLFNSLNSFSDILSAREEKLFGLFLYGCKSIINKYNFFIFILFLVSFYLKYRVILKFSPDVFLSLLIYIYTLFLIYDLNGIRQGLAMAFVLLSISPILKKNIYLFSVLIIAATLSHTSAIIFFPFYWLSRIKLSKRTIFLLIIIIVGVSLPIRFFIQNNSYFNYLLNTNSFSHYSAYIDNDSLNSQTSILSIAVFQRIFVFLIFLINYDKLKVQSDFKRLLLNAYFIGIVIFVFLSFNAEFAARLSYYYKMFEIFIIPIIVISQTKIINKLILIFIFVLLALIGTYRLLQIIDGGLIPYNSIL